ncbi:unnamed protein product, partial [Thlaspi arvense]
MNSKKMKPSSEPDRISTLPHAVLVLIISFLPFKDCIATSILSERWRYLYLHTMNVAFKESEFLNGMYSDRAARVSFASYMSEFVSRFEGEIINTFEIHLCNPVGLVACIQHLIRFAASKQVKKLVLDFSDPSWRSTDVASELDVAIKLPACVYRLKTLESLYIYGCAFDPSRFTNPERLRRLYIGWISLQKLESLLSKCRLLKTLSIRYCWDLDIETLAGRIEELVIEYCDFPRMACSFVLPILDIFKYSGYIMCLDFERVNKMVHDVEFDFGVEPEYDEPDAATKAQGEIVAKLLSDFRSATIITVCPYTLQVIQDNPEFMLRGVEVEHLVLKTKLHPKELMVWSLLRDLSYRGIDPRTHWHQNISYRCLNRTVTTVQLLNFTGGFHQMEVLSYLVKTRPWRVHVITAVDLCVAKGLREDQMRVARAGAAMLRRINKQVVVEVHNDCDCLSVFNGGFRPI